MPSIPKLSPLALAALTLALPAAAIAGAFAFQAAGFAPCELCLKERLPYYAGIVLGVLTLFLAWRGAGLALTACFAALALLFLGSAGFGAYHAGVEWGFWPGPADCTGTLARAPSMADFMKQLQTIKVVRCDAVAIRILGLSLAGWNVVVSLAVAGLAAAGAARRNTAALAAEAPAR
ncbi:MAG: disulfide bond formation protein B [Beijerinckiaceae bacterium]|jgi:disulfide bond formation protein DsbB